MGAKKGSLMRLYQGDGGSPETFTIVGGVQGINWRFGMEPLETTTADDIDANGVSYRTFMPGIASGGGPVRGIAKDNTIQGWIDDALTGTYRNYRVEIPNYGTVTASMFFSNVEFEGPYDGVVSFSAELVLAAAPTTALDSVAPVNTLLPSISGIPQQGQVLTANTGLWTGGGITFTYQWQVDVAGNNTFGNVAGATARTYTPAAGDVTDRVRVIVTATNAHSAVSATSAPTIPVIGA